MQQIFVYLQDTESFTCLRSHSAQQYPDSHQRLPCSSSEPLVVKADSFVPHPGSIYQSQHLRGTMVKTRPSCVLQLSYVRRLTGFSLFVFVRMRWCLLQFGSMILVIVFSLPNPTSRAHHMSNGDKFNSSIVPPLACIMHGALSDYDSGKILAISKLLLIMVMICRMYSKICLPGELNTCSL